MFNSGDVIQYTGATNDDIGNYDLCLIIGFVDDAMAVAVLGQSATYPQLKDIANALASDLDVRGDYENHFIKITSIDEMNRNNVYNVRA